MVKRILHEKDVREVIQHEADKTFAKQTDDVISEPTAASGSYVQAQVTSLVTSINEIRAALIEAGLTKSS